MAGFPSANEMIQGLLKDRMNLSQIQNTVAILTGQQVDKSFQEQTGPSPTMPEGSASVAYHLEQIGHAMRAIDIVYGTDPDWTTIRQEMAALKMTLFLNGFATRSSLKADDPEVRAWLRHSEESRKYREEAIMFEDAAVRLLAEVSGSPILPRLPHVSASGVSLEDVTLDTASRTWSVRGRTPSGTERSMSMTEMAIHQRKDAIKEAELRVRSIGASAEEVARLDVARLFNGKEKP